MESLIEKWKKTSSSTSLSRYSNKKPPPSNEIHENPKLKSFSQSSSSSKESIQTNKQKDNLFQSSQEKQYLKKPSSPYMQQQILRTSQLSLKDEMSKNNIINQLQNQLAESESDKQNLLQKNEMLKKELYQINQNMYYLKAQQEQYQAQNEILAKNNQVLVQQITYLQEKDQQQQLFWNQQVQNLINMMEILKNQLQSQ